MSKPKLIWSAVELMESVPELHEIVGTFADYQVRAMDRPRLLSELGDVQILVTNLKDTIDAEVLDAAPRLKIIGTSSTGTDHIDVKEAERRGITVVSIKEDYDLLDRIQATAEHAWLLLLACNRNFRAATDRTRNQQWYDPSLRGRELIERSIGIIGYGRLGSMIGRFAHAFRMNVYATDPKPVEDPWVTQLPLDELLQTVDNLSIHVHLKDDTRGMIGREQFARMKPGMRIVNTSRGEIIDEDALVEALESGHVAAAGLDVVQGERDSDLHDRPLLRYMRAHDNLIITPHIGGRTYDSQAKACIHFARKLKGTWEQLASSQW